MKKRIFLIIFIINICFILVACGTKIEGRWVPTKEMQEQINNVIDAAPEMLKSGFQENFAKQFYIVFNNDGTFAKDNGGTGTYTKNGSDIELSDGTKFTLKNNKLYTQEGAQNGGIPVLEKSKN